MAQRNRSRNCNSANPNSTEEDEEEQEESNVLSQWSRGIRHSTKKKWEKILLNNFSVYQMSILAIRNKLCSQ